MKALIFDTETTGLPDYKLPVNHPSQPYIVQLAAILADDNGDTVSELNVIIKPENWSVPTGAAEVHGIPTEKAEEFGIPISVALTAFKELYLRADYLVAHNIAFDLRMLKRYAKDQDNFFFQQGHAVNFCTKIAMTDVCKLPPTEKQIAARKRHENPDGTYKWSPPGGWPKYKDPTLTESYWHFFTEEFEGAHNAMIDVEACKAVFYQLKEENLLHTGIYNGKP